MLHLKNSLVLFAIVGVAAIGLWRWEHHRVSPSSSSLHEVVDAAQKQQATKADSSEWARRLSARKGGDDLESATRTFKEASDCLLYYAALREIDSYVNDERLDDLSNRTLASLENIDATSRRYLSIARQTEALCIGSDRTALLKEYINAILKAALLGSPDAESCFVISNPAPVDGREVSADLMHSLEKRYAKYAPLFTKNALERGDPYVAGSALYRYIASPPVHPSLLDDVPKADPYMTWRAARLASLRATPEQRKRLEGDLAMFEEQHLLGPEEIQRADAWARATYERDFSGQPPLDLDAQAPCYSSPELAP